jgi:hypothetical protein
MPLHLVEAHLSSLEKNAERTGTNLRTSEPDPRSYDQQRAWSIAQFCHCFGVGRTTVYEQIKLGHLHARKVGQRTIITDVDAEEWLRNLPRVGTER